MFKPMLAANSETQQLQFPLLASPKLDGVRAIVRDGVVMSRNLKPIPNHHVQTMFRHLEHFDGELIVGDPTHPACYRNTMSGVMSRDGVPDAFFYVFDHVEHPTKPYVERRKHLQTTNVWVKHVPQHTVKNLDELLVMEEDMLTQGYEGLILRADNAPYKHGRSTLREGYLLKLKRFMDSEAMVIGMEERLMNCNEATTDALGRTVRSSHKANMTGRGDLGALIVKWGEHIFTIGTGFDDAMRREIWDNKSNYIDTVVKFKYFPLGSKDLPRFPVFLGWRHEVDLS